MLSSLVVILMLGGQPAPPENFAPDFVVQVMIANATDAEVEADHIFLDVLGYETGEGTGRTEGLIAAYTRFYIDYRARCAVEGPPRVCFDVPDARGQGPESALLRSIDEHIRFRAVDEAMAEFEASGG